MAKTAEKEAQQCQELQWAINEHLKSGGKGLALMLDDTEGADVLNILEIHEKIESGKLVVKDGFLTRNNREL